MPSLFGRFIKWQLRLIRPALVRMTLGANRRAQDRLGKLESRAFSKKVEGETLHFEKFAAELIQPHGGAGEAAILYLHGGGYTAGSLDYARGFGSVLAAKTGRAVLCAAYRLAPENPYPAALDDALAAYQWLLARYPAERIALAGESAGGGLVFSLALLLKERGLPMPEKLVGISPWTDLTMQGKSYKENRKKDPSLSKAKLSWYAQVYAGKKLSDPLVSPVFGDFTGFPPALLFAGADEMLRSDAQLLAQRYQEAGASCRLVVQEGMWHVYVLFILPEARVAQDEIAQFLKGEA